MKSVERLVYPDKYLLCDILCILFHVDKAHGSAEYLSLVPLHQRPEGSIIACSDFFYELFF